MLELALKGSKRYYGWIAFLLVLIGIGGAAYVNQLVVGLETTGMSRDVSWGFYISQFTYLVGLAASGVMIVLPNYFHSYKSNKHMVIFGEFMAIAACIMCLLFIIVDIGQPTRAMNMIFHATPNSILFWDMIVLNGYLGLNLLVGWTCLQADRVGLPHPKWLKPFILYVHHLGLLHPHRDSVPVPGPARPPLLAHRHPGCPLPGFRVLFRTRHPPPCDDGHGKVHHLQDAQERPEDSGQDHCLRHVREHVLLRP